MPLKQKEPAFQTFTVGKLDAGMAILIGTRAHLIEFPSLLLPPGTVSGSIVSISVHRNHAAERSHAAAFKSLQEDILNAYGARSPEPPVLTLRNTTQTSVTLEWDRLELAGAKLRSVEIYRNGTRLAAIPNPTHNTSTKLSSLAVDTDYTFQLVMKTTAGTYPSNVIRVRTHTINDTSGISVCFGTVQNPEQLALAKAALEEMGAKYSDKIQIDTTHFVCSTPAGTGNVSGPSVEYQKALQLTLPVVEPQWILACLHQKKMVPISQHLLGTHPQFAASENFSRVADSTSPRSPIAGMELARQPSNESRARAAAEEEEQQQLQQQNSGEEIPRPRSGGAPGGILNRGFKFPLSAEAIAAQQQAAAASGSGSQSPPTIVTSAQDGAEPSSSSPPAEPTQAHTIHPNQVPPGGVMPVMPAIHIIQPSVSSPIKPMPRDLPHEPELDEEDEEAYEQHEHGDEVTIAEAEEVRMEAAGEPTGEGEHQGGEEVTLKEAEEIQQEEIAAEMEAEVTAPVDEEEEEKKAEPEIEASSPAPAIAVHEEEEETPAQGETVTIAEAEEARATEAEVEAGAGADLVNQLEEIALDSKTEEKQMEEEQTDAQEVVVPEEDDDDIDEAAPSVPDSPQIEESGQAHTGGAEGEKKKNKKKKKKTTGGGKK